MAKTGKYLSNKSNKIKNDNDTSTSNEEEKEEEKEEEYTSFDDVTSADKYHMESFDEWRPKLGADELSSIKEYTGSAYSSLNAQLWNGNGDVTKLDWGNRALAHNIDSALGKYTLKHNTTFYRGAYETWLKNSGLPTDVDGLNASKGAIIHSDAYMSASVNKYGGFHKPYRYVIRMKAGTGKGAYVNPVSKFKSTGNTGENEFLINRNRNFRLDGAEHGSSFTIVYLTEV